MSPPNENPPRPNQSLKLIPHRSIAGQAAAAVDDFARAKQIATIGLDIPRAEWLPSLRRFAAAAYLSRCFLAGAPVR